MKRKIVPCSSRPLSNSLHWHFAETHLMSELSHVLFKAYVESNVGIGKTHGSRLESIQHFFQLGVFGVCSFYHFGLLKNKTVEWRLLSFIARIWLLIKIKTYLVVRRHGCVFVMYWWCLGLQNQILFVARFFFFIALSHRLAWFVWISKDWSQKKLKVAFLRLMGSVTGIYSVTWTRIACVWALK